MLAAADSSSILFVGTIGSFAMAINKTSAKLTSLISAVALVVGLFGAASSVASLAKDAPKESEKVYSPDKQFFAYVRGSDETVPAGNGEVSADVIWMGTTEKKTAYPLFRRGATMKSGQPIGDIYLGGISGLQFSDDNKEIYFLNAAFAVSYAVLAIDIKTRKIRYVIDGSTLELIRTGKWKGKLVVSRHKYKPNGGGAYEARCLVTPEGKEIKQLKAGEP